VRRPGRGPFQNHFGLAVFDLGMNENNSNWKLPNILVSIAIIFVLLVLFRFVMIPNFVGGHHYSPMNACINNLRQIDAAKQQWAWENNKTNFDTVITWNDVTPYLGRGASGSLVSVYCPEDMSKKCTNSYTLGDLGSRPKCKINPTHVIH
jgi:hypothetical protein